MEILVLLIVCFVGVIIGMGAGFTISNSIHARRSMGRLRIDRSEPDEPTRMFVELKDVTPDMIAQHKSVIFDVINESYISHD